MKRRSSREANVKAQRSAADMEGDAAVLARAVPMDQGTLTSNEFVFMPAGENVITATVNDQPEEITVIVNAASAQRLQADLTAKLARQPEPFLDYDHSGGRASGHPKAFRWDPQRGVICEVEWTAAARSAIRDREYKYFSPEFRYGRKTKTVNGLRASAAVGGLVNDPAFTAIEAVKARRASNDFPPPNPADGPHDPTNHTTPSTMEKNIVAALVAAGILSHTEQSSDGAPALVTARLAELKAGGEPTVKAAHASTLKAREDRIAELETELKATKTSAAKAAVDEAVKAGRIPAKDEATRKFWEESIVARGEDAVKALRAQPAGKALTPTNSASTEEKPEDVSVEDEAESEAIQARAVVIAREQKLPFNAAWASAQAEVKARRA